MRKNTLNECQFNHTIDCGDDEIVIMIEVYG